MLGKKAIYDLMPMQDGDVETTFADISRLKEITDFNVTPIETGVERFIGWYRKYYHV